MEFTKEMNDAIQAWQSEDEKNRAIIVLGVERSNLKEDGDCDYSTGGWVIGNGGILMDTLCHTLEDKDPKNRFADLLRAAARRVQLKEACECLEGHLDKIQKLAKELGLTDDDTEATETGKEASHE